MSAVLSSIFGAFGWTSAGVCAVLLAILVIKEIFN